MTRALKLTQHVSTSFTKAEVAILRDAAKDAHMELRDYCRLMLLAAAGMGGVTEHLERAIDASWKAEKP